MKRKTPALPTGNTLVPSREKELTSVFEHKSSPDFEFSEARKSSIPSSEST
jgi:hypothetical protein